MKQLPMDQYWYQDTENVIYVCNVIVLDINESLYIVMK